MGGPSSSILVGTTAEFPWYCFRHLRNDTVRKHLSSSHAFFPRNSIRRTASKGAALGTDSQAILDSDMCESEDEKDEDGPSPSGRRESLSGARSPIADMLWVRWLDQLKSKYVG